MLAAGAAVSLETDPSQGERDSTPSRRLLGYFWLGDGRMFNREMIREGYAHEYTYRTPYRYQAEFKVAEREARAARRGLWAPETCNGDTKRPATTAQPTASPQTASTPPPPTSTPSPPTSTVATATPTAPPVPTATKPPPPTSTRSSAPAGQATPATGRPKIAFESVQGAEPNRRATVAARTEPPVAGVQCSIRYVTPQGTPSDAQGLGDRVTDGVGRVSWSWIVGGRTGAGMGQVRVRCGDGEWATADIEIP